MKEVVLPAMGQTVEAASIVEWLKEEGDTVEEGELLFTMQTDKAEIECESPDSGVLRKILLDTDIEMPVMTVVALIGSEDEEMPDLGQYASDGAGAETVESSPEAKPAAVLSAVDAQTPADDAASDMVAAVSPRAGALARKLGVDPAGIAGTGPGGRVIEEDVLAAADGGGERTAAPSSRKLPEATGRLEPLTPMRKIIAERLSESKYSSPHFYLTVQVDMSRAGAFRAESGDFKPTYNDLIMQATAVAIGKCPEVNVRWRGDTVEYVDEINMGFAVALDQGLMVPVVKGIDAMSLHAIHDACADLAEKARTNKLTPEHYTGNTFTISNLGAFGVDQFTAIINPPDSAILAVGAIADTPVAVEDEVCVRPVMKLTLSSDHRIVDGATAAKFMATLKEVIEEGNFRADGP